MPIYLCVDNSVESKLAVKLLTERGFSFEEIKSPHVRGPVLYTPEGNFKMIEGIRMYIAIAHHDNRVPSDQPGSRIVAVG